MSSSLFNQPGQQAYPHDGSMLIPGLDGKSRIRASNRNTYSRLQALDGNPQDTIVRTNPVAFTIPHNQKPQRPQASGSKGKATRKGSGRNKLKYRAKKTEAGFNAQKKGKK